MAQFGFGNKEAAEEKSSGFNPLGVGPRGPDTDSTSYQIKAFEEGTDYVFFQSPSPKYGRQEDLPSFFSGENIGEILNGQIITPVRLAIGAVGIASFVAVSSVLFTAPGSATPFAFLDDFVPAAKEYRAAQGQKRVDFEAVQAKEAAEAKAATEAAAAKAAAEAAAKAKAAATAK